MRTARRLQFGSGARRLGWAGLFCALAACSAAPPPQPRPPAVAARPPTPTSVTVKEPGGDAESPHRAALERLLAAPWGARNDKDDTIWAPTPDWENWRRVHYFGVDTFTGFRYGDEHHTMAVVFVQDMPAGTPVTSDNCMRRFEAWGLPQTHAFEVKFGPFEPRFSKWHNAPLEMRSVDGHVNFGFISADFSAAWAAYPAYPDACLIYAIAVPWRDSGDLAQKLRDRWLNEGFPLMLPRTAQRPIAQ